MISLQRMHHVAIIASDYARSKHFYCQMLGFTLIGENYCAERDSWKGDLSLQGEYLIKPFSLPGVPGRFSQPEAQGVRHLTFSVAAGVACKPVRVDELTGKKCTFFADPDRLPQELYDA